MTNEPKLEIPEIHLEGSNYEMGFQCGTECGSLIKSAIETNYKITLFYNNLTRSECISNIQNFLPKLQQQVPELCDEMRGISHASGIPYEDILVLNFHGRDLVRGCTIFFLDGSATKDGCSITGQTIDWTPDLKKFYRVIHQKPDQGPEFVQFTIPGLLGLVGKNSSGLNVLMSVLLTSENIELGVPAYLMLRSAMKENSVNDAIKALKEKKRASPFNYVLSDDSGDAVDIEAGPNFFLEHHTSGSPFYVHTNHCLDRRLKDIDIFVQTTKSEETVTRYSKMTEMLGPKAKDAVSEDEKKLNFEDVYRLLTNHDGYPDSICRHPRDEAPDEAKMCTVGAILSRQGENGLWVTWGNPCESPPLFFPLH